MKKLYTLFLSLLGTAALQAQSITFEDLTVPASGQWSIVRPGTVGGHAVFYRAEFFDDSR